MSEEVAARVAQDALAAGRTGRPALSTVKDTETVTETAVTDPEPPSAPRLAPAPAPPVPAPSAPPAEPAPPRPATAPRAVADPRPR